MAFWLLQGCSLELGLNLTMQDPGIWHPAPAKFRDFMGTLAAPGIQPGGLEYAGSTGSLIEKAQCMMRRAFCRHFVAVNRTLRGNFCYVI